MPRETWTILEVLKWTTSYLRSNGIEQPRLDAEILLAHALGIDRVGLYLRYDQPLTDSELSAYKGLIRRRIRREPIAYITGLREFWSLDLFVTPDVMIPRPETEILVEAALSLITNKKTTNHWTVLDLGTGSGAIVIALACKEPAQKYYATDVSKAALGVARKNAYRHGVEGMITFLNGYWFEPVRNLGRYFDMIISNPPYIKRSHLKNLAPEINEYEPRIALDGGEDGLTALRYLAKHSAEYLSPDGSILFEIDHEQRDAVVGLLAETKRYKDIVVLKDYSGLDRAVQARVA
nr:peptide chain release factor N(5)-glutamine methyltransferase [Desulfobacterales bacterium]